MIRDERTFCFRCVMLTKSRGVICQKCGKSKYTNPRKTHNKMCRCKKCKIKKETKRKEAKNVPRGKSGTASSKKEKR